MATFEADIVWALAVAVDRENNGYCKTDEWDETPEGEKVVTRRPNKILMKHRLAEGNYNIVTDEDRAHAEELRTHFTGYLMKELSGNINDFEKSVLRIAQMESFHHRNLLEFAIISCLPNSYRREMKHKAYLQDVIESTPIDGDIGDTIIGELVIAKCYYNENYSKFRITGRFGESFVDFWYKDNLSVDSTVKIRAKIKQHRPDNTTQLNYIKVLKD